MMYQKRGNALNIRNVFVSVECKRILVLFCTYFRKNRSVVMYL